MTEAAPPTGDGDVAALLAVLATKLVDVQIDEQDTETLAERAARAVLDGEGLRDRWLRTGSTCFRALSDRMEMLTNFLNLVPAEFKGIPDTFIMSGEYRFLCFIHHRISDITPEAVRHWKFLARCERTRLMKIKNEVGKVADDAEAAGIIDRQLPGAMGSELSTLLKWKPPTDWAPKVGRRVEMCVRVLSRISRSVPFGTV